MKSYLTMLQYAMSSALWLRVKQKVIDLIAIIYHISYHFLHSVSKMFSIVGLSFVNRRNLEIQFYNIKIANTHKVYLIREAVAENFLAAISCITSISGC